jgi:O-acetyl-ADP-ribose deacetylase (regulator of RNase III)
MTASRYAPPSQYGRMEQVCGSRRESETMITYVDANLFTSPAQTLVNTVNTVGVMGKGIAKAFKTVYPDMFEEYASLCRRGEFTT